MFNIRATIKKIPSSSGVYFFKDPKNQVLYIGKASNLKNRLGSYRKTADPRIKKMLVTANNLDWQETSSEIEALILESQLIKKHHPPYNIMLRDDKQYFYVGFTKEKFPRIFLTHQPHPNQTKITLEQVKQKLVHGSVSDNPSFAVRRRGVRRKKEGLSLTDRQTKITFNGPFTEGSSLKVTLKLLRKIFPYCTCQQRHHRYCLNYHLGNCLGFCCLKNLTKFRDREKWSIYQKNIRAIQDILKSKKTSVLKNLEKEMSQLAKQDEFEKAIGLRKKIAKLKQVFANAKVIKELAGKEKTLAEMQKILNLPFLPQRIEGYDISNIQGQFATGSMAVFTNGQPDKNEYRQFKIRISGHSNDTGMLKEILARRFNHSEWPWPDLILIDGGKSQLSAATSIIPKNIFTMALTKNKRHQGHHIFYSTLYQTKALKRKEKTIIMLSDLADPVRNLILHIDAEAHRFAISYYRQLHRKNYAKSV